MKQSKTHGKDDIRVLAKWAPLPWFVDKSGNNFAVIRSSKPSFPVITVHRGCGPFGPVDIARRIVNLVNSHANGVQDGKCD